MAYCAAGNISFVWRTLLSRKNTLSYTLSTTGGSRMTTYHHNGHDSIYPNIYLRHLNSRLYLDRVQVIHSAHHMARHHALDEAPSPSCGLDGHKDSPPFSI
ncbi:hypothetical protein ACKVWC_011459 [Pyricularia oryzae]